MLRLATLAFKSSMLRIGFVPMMQKRFIFERLQKRLANSKEKDEFKKFMDFMLSIDTFSLDDYISLLTVIIFLYYQDQIKKLKELQKLNEEQASQLEDAMKKLNILHAFYEWEKEPDYHLTFKEKSSIGQAVGEEIKEINSIARDHLQFT